MGGIFTVETTDASTKPLTVTPPGYLTRETSLTGGEGRSGVLFDLIGAEAPRAQYQHLVRNAFEALMYSRAPGNLEPDTNGAPPPPAVFTP